MNTQVKTLLAIPCILVFTAISNAASVNSNGTLVDLTPPGNGVGTDVADIDATGAASDGYYLFNVQPEGTNISNRPWDENAVNSLPAYVGTLDGTGSTSSGGWANYDDVTVGGLTFNTGGVVLSPGEGVETRLFSFTLDGAVPPTVTAGLIADNSDSLNWDVSNVRIEGPGGITANQDVDRNGGTDLVLFNIDGGASGETYTIYGTSPPSGALLGGITFTSIPEPASVSLLGLGLMAALSVRKKRRRC